MTPNVDTHFSQTYVEARGKFRHAAAQAKLTVQSVLHPRAGRDGELLATDVVLDGPSDAQRLLIVSSACHGVEGFCGSGIQVAMLHDEAWRRTAHEAGVAVLYVHALNPFGFSWWQRTTHENVDLNRNFRDFSQPLPRNVAYDDIASWVVPAEWPPGKEVLAAISGYVAEHGAAAWQAAVSGGQYHHADGLFYGGDRPTWSNVTVRQILQTYAAGVTQLAWIDLHTGLGPSGVGEPIFGCRTEPAAVARARAWWGEGVTLLDDGTSASSPLTGLLWHVPHEECPQAEYTAIGLEFGTVPVTEMIDALRADQWLSNHPDASAHQHAAIKRQVRDAFYTDNSAWKSQVTAQTLDAARRAVRGLTQTCETSA
jgi:hypothetical protein